MKAVILAGGKGRRLRPYTTVLPKPLMPLGDLPIIEVVLRQLAAYGFDDVVMAVGYLAELLMAVCGDGSRFGVRLRYSREEEPLGTAGPLALIEGLDDTFLVMNGDVLTTLDLAALVAAHRRSGALATIATHQRQQQINYGIVESDGANRITAYIEKPVYHYQVSMGIYALEPAVLRFVPRGQYLDLPDLVRRLLAAGHPVHAYPFDGYWMDIGRPDDYERAVEEFDAMRPLLLPSHRLP
ncbi:MAG: sugar phosphate nucleotidyltransferase [Caldilineales bacterium]|nr:sugar phosphate nucleotidyltransferase [Caldilineales bacterium]MDW8319548.1 sugar phosphate nucleotidyltransferase [Anaerolineae bacterium]